MPMFAPRLALMVRGCAAVSKAFARSHPLLTATAAATVTSHIVDAAWGQRAPLALGIAVAAGYALILLGAVPAFIRERRKAKGKPGALTKAVGNRRYNQESTSVRSQTGSWRHPRQSRNPPAMD